MLLGIDPTKSHPIDQMLKGYDKKSSAQSSRLPIDAKLVAKLQDTASRYVDSYYTHAFISIYTLMYKLALRISEISNYSRLHNHALKIQNIQFAKSAITVKLDS